MALLFAESSVATRMSSSTDSCRAAAIPSWYPQVQVFLLRACRRDLRRRLRVTVSLALTAAWCSIKGGGESGADVPSSVEWPRLGRLRIPGWTFRAKACVCSQRAPTHTAGTARRSATSARCSSRQSGWCDSGCCLHLIHHADRLQACQVAGDAPSNAAEIIA